MPRNGVRVPKEPDVVDYFLKRILRRDTLSPEEERALRDAADGVDTYPAGADLASEGERPDHSTLLVQGFTTRYRLLAVSGGSRDASQHGARLALRRAVCWSPSGRWQSAGPAGGGMRPCPAGSAVVDGTTWDRWRVTAGRREATANRATVCA